MPILWQQDSVQAKACLGKGQGKIGTMKYTAKLLVKGDPNKLFECLAPEDKDFDRSSFTINKTSDGLEFNIVANDAVAFRATLNSISQLLIVFESTVRK